MRYFLILFFLVAFNNPIIAQHEIFQTHINVVEFDGLKNKIFESHKPYKLVFMFNQFCPASRDVFPELDKLYKNSTQENFELFVVSKTKEKNKEELQDHLFYYGYEESFYIIKNKPLLGFYNKLVKNICESCNAREMGYGDFIVYDQENKVLFQSNNTQSKDYHLEVLKKYMK